MSATFGEERIRQMEGQTWGHMIGSYFFCPERGVADSITVWTMVGYGITVKCGIFRKSDGALIGETEQKWTDTAGGWLNLNFISKPELENREYWLVLFSRNEPGWGGRRTLNPIKFGSKRWTVSPYPVFPTVCPLKEHPWDSRTPFLLCIYCTYTPLAVPPVGHTITISTPEGGVTDPTGQYVYADGAFATVVAMPNADYVFDHWELDGVPRTENPIVVLMDADHMLTPFFTYVTPPPPEECSVLFTVVDALGVPLEGAAVSFNGGSGITDHLGTLLFADLSLKTYGWSVSLAGHVAQSGQIACTEAATYGINVTLIAVTPPPPPPPVESLLPAIGSAVTGIVLVAAGLA